MNNSQGWTSATASIQLKTACVAVEGLGAIGPLSMRRLWTEDEGRIKRHSDHEEGERTSATSIKKWKKEKMRTL